MTFYTYLKEVLRFPLCKYKVFEAIFKAISSGFDDLVKDIYKLQKQFFITKDTWQNFTEERGITPFKNESQEMLKKRTVNAFAFYQNIQTLEGVKGIIELIVPGYHYDIYLAGTNSFIVGKSRVGKAKIGGSPFTYIIRFYDDVNGNDLRLLEEALQTYCRAYVKINIVFQVYYSAFIVGKSRVSKIKIKEKNNG